MHAYPTHTYTHILESPVERVTSMKILGVTVSDNLRATDHVAEVIIYHHAPAASMLFVCYDRTAFLITASTVSPKQRLLPV